MHNWVVLLRGINVGGRNIVPMKQLAEMLVEMGAKNVQTYIQSGNVLLQIAESNAQQLASSIAIHIEQTFAFKPQVLVLTQAQFAQAAANNPFPKAQSEPKTLHLYFLAAPANDCDLTKLTELKKTTESFELTEQVFYLHAPDGIGRSKLAEKVESLLGVATTARNWNTVSKLLVMFEK